MVKRERESICWLLLSVYCILCTVGELFGDSGLRLMPIQTVNLDSAVVQATYHHGTKQLPPDCPTWAACLHDCEVTETNYMVLIIIIFV